MSLFYDTLAQTMNPCDTQLFNAYLSRILKISLKNFFGVVQMIIIRT